MNCYVLFKKSANSSILVSTGTCLAPSVWGEQRDKAFPSDWLFYKEREKFCIVMDVYDQKNRPMNDVYGLHL